MSGLILEDVSGLGPCSTRRVAVRCDYGVSEDCKVLFTKKYQDLVMGRQAHPGKDMCMFCSRSAEIGSARSNRYSVNRSFFENIDSPEKAYVLGWIASDGSISPQGVRIGIHKDDHYVLEGIRNIVCEELPLRSRGKNMIELVIYSEQIVQDVCGHLNISPGKKSHSVGFPNLANPALTWEFIRGVFEGDGWISNLLRRSLSCIIRTSSSRMREGIRQFCGTGCIETGDGVHWYGVNALDFLGNLYRDPLPDVFLYRKYILYDAWSCWRPSDPGFCRSGETPHFSWTRMTKTAPPPTYEDGLYQFELVRQYEWTNGLPVFGTGIRVRPKEGCVLIPGIIPALSLWDPTLNESPIIDSWYMGEAVVKMKKPLPKDASPPRVLELYPIGASK